MMRFVVVVLALVAIASAASADLAVRQAYYRDTNWSVHVFLENRGKESIEPAAPVVQGFDTAKLGRDGRTAGAVLWYRCWPKAIPAGGIADLTITLAAEPKKPVEVIVPWGSGKSVKAVVPVEPEELTFQAIRFSKDLRTVHLYVRWAGSRYKDSIQTVRMDGRVAKLARRSENCDGLGYAQVVLANPLEKGSFHVFEAQTASGISTAYQIRAIPAEFLIGLYGSVSKENIQDWAAHGCNHYISFGSLGGDVVAELNAAGMSSGARYIPQQLADRPAGKMIAFDEADSEKIIRAASQQPGFLYHSLVDEPDAGDYYVGKRIGASSMELVARETFCREIDPTHYSFVQLDNTFRPRSYAVYGETADVLATHRYSLGSYINPEAGATTGHSLQFLEDLRDTVEKLRTATAPKPMFMVSQFFDLGPGRSGRPQSIEEMRLQCYTMIAGGARGIIHYIHSGSSGGHEGGKSPELWNAMTAMHAELKRVGEVAMAGTPAPAGWVHTDSANIYADAVVSDLSVAVILTNRAHRSDLAKFAVRPTDRVKVSLRIPPWMRASKMRVISADDMKPVEASVQGNELSFVADEVRDARCFLLSPTLH